MTTQELIKKIFFRLGRLKIIILLGGILIGTLFYMYALSKPVIYSVTSTLFPLSAGAESSSASRITEILGGGGSSKSITEEASVSIEEVGKSKKTREAVVSQRLPAYRNKTIAEILIDEYNRHLPFGVSPIKVIKTDSANLITGSEILKSNYVVKFSKSSLLEVTFSSTDPNLLSPVSYLLIDKISQFYRELKISKATSDFDFTDQKVDSLQRVLYGYDRRRITQSNTTLFVPQGKLKYSIPQENLENNKQRVLAQRNGAAANREDALWRLQRVTPTIKILDKPEPPYMTTKSSKILYGAGGFFLGIFLFAFASIAGLLYQYLNQQMKELIGDKYPDVNTTATA